MKKVTIMLMVLLTIGLTSMVPVEKKEPTGMCIFVMPVGGLCLATTLPGTNHCFQHASVMPPTECLCMTYVYTGGGSGHYCLNLCLEGTGKCRTHSTPPPPPPNLQDNTKKINVKNSGTGDDLNTQGMSTVKAKFRCESVADTDYGSGHQQRKVTFRAVYGQGDENKSFSKATPAGNLDMVIDQGTGAYDAFKPGKNYYLTIEEEVVKEA